MATDTQLHQSSGGVKTYRGRTLEELLPQIRTELGPDAIILREREGLVGGVGGFFAQRFIEVEARRGEGQSIDIYDDAPEADLRTRARGAGAPRAVAKPKAELPPEPTELGVRPAPLPPEPTQIVQPRQASQSPQGPQPSQGPQPRQDSQRRQASPPKPTTRSKRISQPTPFVPRELKLEPAAHPTRRFDTTVFMERLREASAVLPDEAPEAPRSEAPEPAAPAPAVPEAAAPDPAGSEPAAPELEASEPAATKPAIPRARTAARSPRSAPPKRRPMPARKTLEATTDRPRAARPPYQRPAAPELPETPYPFQPVSRGRRSIAPESPVARLTSPASASRETPAAALSPRLRRPHARSRQGDGARAALAWLLAGLRRTGPTKPAPGQPLDLVAATHVANELSTRGASPAWTSQLISAAGAHGSPLSGGSLRAAAVAEVARRIVPAPALPVNGAAIAFIGAGGSGKTRCTAALASAYRRSSTLEVTVVTLDNPDGARELRRLLRSDQVPVLSLSGKRAQQAVEDGRDGGLVVVDTAATTPTDASAVRSLQSKLAPLGLDALYVALPATLGPQAARRALASFGGLKPSAVAITHADETDQLAVAVEIAVAHRIPLAYFHTGTDHTVALSAVDPPAVAQQLFA